MKRETGGKETPIGEAACIFKGIPMQSKGISIGDTHLENQSRRNSDNTVPQGRMRMSEWSRQWILEAGQSLEAFALAVCSCVLIGCLVGWMVL